MATTSHQPAETIRDRSGFDVTRHERDELKATIKRAHRPMPSRARVHRPRGGRMVRSHG
jgi:hypothetical protein